MPARAKRGRLRCACGAEHQVFLTYEGVKCEACGFFSSRAAAVPYEEGAPRCPGCGASCVRFAYQPRCVNCRQMLLPPGAGPSAA